MPKINFLKNCYGTVFAFLIYIKLKLDNSGKTRKIGLPHIFYPIYLRSKTSDISAFRQIFVHKEYNINFDFIPRFIIDAGAYVGLAAVYFSNKFPNAEIISIEPEKNNLIILEKNLAPYKNVQFIKRAISIYPDQVLEVVDTGLGNWGFRTLPKAIEKSQNIVDTVKTITLNEILKESKFEYIDILKIDIEGAEKELFESNYDEWLSKTRCIIIELHDSIHKDVSNNLFAAISKYDFTYFKKGENLVFINSKLLSSEALPVDTTN